MTQSPDAPPVIRQGTTLDSTQREAMDYDVVIVGAGPAGLAAAIRLKQTAQKQDMDVSVCVVEKGSEVGAHILSGAVIDPKPLADLFPDWKEQGAPLNTPVRRDRFFFLTRKKSYRLPNILMPPLMSNHGNYIASLGNLCRWLAEKAEALGVEIYPGFAAGDVLFDGDGRVCGIATSDMGVSRDGEKKSTWTPGVELRGKYTLFAEGARGSLSKKLIRHFNLDANSQPQKFGIGLKELWEVPPEKHAPGLVQHSFGWPLARDTGGGSFLYHMEDNLIAVGFVVHLDYNNPHLSPFDEFQRFKTHPSIRPILEGGKRIAYGARVITEGGLQSVPELIFPGGALVGCAAGFVNVPRIKGSHNAIASGILAADAAVAALAGQRSNDRLEAYQTAWKKSPIARELKTVRNVKPLWGRFGLFIGIPLAAADMWMRTLRIGLPVTLRHKKDDAASMKKAALCPPIAYPKPDGVVSFDKTSSVFLAATSHDEDQPVHLVVSDPAIPVSVNLPDYDEPAQRYCPAGVYEIINDADSGGPRLQINAQNCVHCKTCDIKDPSRNINWIVPEGGSGPNYPNM